MREGYYAVYYATPLGSGMGMFLLETGRIIGCDMGGGMWGGSYKHDPATNKLAADMEIVYPDGGASSLSGLKQPGEKDQFKTLLPTAIGDTHQEMLPTSAGDVAVIFRRLRDPD